MAVQSVGTNNQVHVTNNIPKNKIIPTGEVKFDELFEKTEEKKDESVSKINELIEGIESIKSSLETDLTVENLQNFKDAVKDFLEYYTKNEMYLQEDVLRDSRGTPKKLAIVKAVDEKLNSLTEDLLQKNFGHFEALNKIGEISGLILNFYA